MNKELEAPFLHRPFSPTCPSLGGMQIPLKESPDIFKNAELGFKEVHPGEQIEHKVTLLVIGSPEHVHGGVGLTEKMVSGLEVWQQMTDLPGKASNDTVYIIRHRWWRKRFLPLEILDWFLPVFSMGLDSIPQDCIGALVVYHSRRGVLSE